MLKKTLGWLFQETVHHTVDDIVMLLIKVCLYQFIQYQLTYSTQSSRRRTVRTSRTYTSNQYHLTRPSVQ